MPVPRPTPEQDAAVAAFGTGEHLALQAGAGTGKTTTLAMLGASTPRRGLYIAFNKSIAQEARHTFPRNVKCKTVHALAYAAVGHQIAEDFTEPEDPENVDAAGEPLPAKIDAAEARLAYVAVTRARHRLDLGGLSWINRHPDGNPNRIPEL